MEKKELPEEIQIKKVQKADVYKRQIDIKGLNIKDTRRQIMLYSDGTLDIELEETTHMLDEVTITSGRIQNVKSTQLGAETLRPTQLKNIPMALGEVDILKMVQALQMCIRDRF